MTQDAPSLLQQLTLNPDQVIGLPPELRDSLLDYLATWGPPAELVAITETLREAFGPLLHLLDLLALARFQAGQYAECLDTLERRQRRSPTIAGQVWEARCLLAMGHTQAARDLAEDLGESYPRNLMVIGAAVEILDALGEFAQSRALLDGLLIARAHDPVVMLHMARHAQRADDFATADQFLQRLGAGVPAGLDARELQEFATLLAHMERRESEQAVRLELERRRVDAFQSLHAALHPLRELGMDQIADAAAIFERLSGPASLPLDRKEERKIQLEAVRHFGYMQLREGQTEVIAGVLRGESILTVMPTGAGKSLCYQLPALMLPRATLVISPLVALMKDQVEGLPAAARKLATFVNSTLTDVEMAQRLQGIADGDYKLIYAAPERLRQLAFLAALRKAGIGLFVLDEAHCVSLWGHDFRPDYLFIQEARAALANPPALAMTATAPPRVRDEIIDYIRDSAPSPPGSPSAKPMADARTDKRANGRMGVAGANGGDSVADDMGGHDGDELTAQSARPRVLTLDIFRNNLFLSALQFHNEEDKLAAMLKLVGELDGSGIVYVNSRHKSESLAFELRKIGVAAEAYHAGIEARGAIQDRFMAGKTRVVVATVAFGMGIDKSDIRFIIHFHPARSLAAYYQEVGRAGRDGKPSQGILFYSNNDWTNLRRWAKSGEMSVDFLESVYAAVATQLGVHIHEQDAPADWETIVGPVDNRRLQQILNTDETTSRVAVSILERADLLTRGFDLPQEFTIILPKPPRGKKAAPPLPIDPEFERLRKGLALRPGEAATFKMSDLSGFMGWALDEVEPALLEWEAIGALQLFPARRVMAITLPARPADMRDRLERILAQSGAVAQRRIDDIVGYATGETCRHGYISAHFGSPPRSRCNVCDSCTGIRPEVPPSATPTLELPDDADVEPMIIDCLLSVSKHVGKSGLARILAGSLRAPVTADQARHHGRLKALGEAAIIAYIEDMVEDNRLRAYDRQGYPVLAATLRGRGEAERWLEQHPELAQLGDAPEVEAGGEDADTSSAGEKYTALQKAIWNWRRRTAETNGQPSYMIMSNELILRIAEARPQSLDDLARLPGMGAQRLEYYGPTILDLIHLHPAQEEDEALMQAQRAAGTTGGGRGPAATPAVSPQMQRRIFMKLQEMRQKISVESRYKSQEIASTTLLRAIAESAPGSLEELHAIRGFGESALAQHDTQILTVINSLLQVHGS
ncbi:MAG: HRDC domain-containing protein [Litorilinea sp.]